MSLNASVTASYFVRFQIAETQKNHEKSSKRIESKRPRRFPESSIYILTDLPGCVAHEVAICFVLPWLNVLRCSLGRQAGILRGLEKNTNPLSKHQILSRKCRIIVSGCFRMFQVSYGFHTSFLHVSHCRESPTFLILTCEQSGPSRFCARLGVPSHGHNNGSTKRSASLAKLSDNYSDCVDSPASYAGATSQSLDLHWIFTGSSLDLQVLHAIGRSSGHPAHVCRALHLHLDTNILGGVFLVPLQDLQGVLKCAET